MIYEIVFTSDKKTHRHTDIKMRKVGPVCGMSASRVSPLTRFFSHGSIASEDCVSLSQSDSKYKYKKIIVRSG